MIQIRVLLLTTSLLASSLSTTVLAGRSPRTSGSADTAAGAAASATSNSETWVWEEEIPLEVVVDEDTSTKIKIPRHKLWSTEKQAPLTLRSLMQQHSKDKATTVQPHKLRTNLWELKIQWRGKKLKETLQLEFSDNGYVRLLASSHDDNTTTTASIGKWELASHGVTWNLYMPESIVFYGDLLLNPFGTQPKMIRGVVLSDPSVSRTWFRPVLATFTGRGIGEDTADLSYRNRKSVI